MPEMLSKNKNQSLHLFRQFLIFLIVFLVGLNGAFANVENQEVYYNVIEQGVASFRKADYTKSIEYFKTALSLNPDDVSVKNNLAAAYISRGTVNFNNKTNLLSATNDYRTALFYLKYSNKGKSSEVIKKNIKISPLTFPGFQHYRGW